MKKLFVLFGLFLSIATFAQKGYHIGIIGGPMFSAQLNKQDFDNADVRFDGIYVGGGGGITFNYHFTDALGVGTQVLYVAQGFKYKNRSGTEYVRKVNYVKLPILLHVNSSPEKIVGGYFYIGPQFNFLAGKNFIADGHNLKNENTTAYNIYSGVNKSFTFGAALGAGMVFNILDGKLQVNLGLRLEGDFLDSYKGKDLNGTKLITGKYTDFDNTTGVFATDPNTGNRSPTHNVGGMVEIGVKYVIIKR